ncbi:MAG: thiamine pyrophosphate-dependent enzyme, partial [Atribacterota bacterium]|nr:thiamine pyrophosphate-dependent enzyme [Atribacterota bacterium]
EAAKKAIERVRKGEGPSLIEIKVNRLRGHFEGDGHLYRPKEDLELAKKKDSILKFEKLLLEKKIITDKEVENIRKRIEEEVEEVIEFARKSPYPKPEEALENVFIGGN